MLQSVIKGINDAQVQSHRCRFSSIKKLQDSALYCQKLLSCNHYPRPDLPIEHDHSFQAQRHWKPKDHLPDFISTELPVTPAAKVNKTSAAKIPQEELLRPSRPSSISKGSADTSGRSDPPKGHNKVANKPSDTVKGTSTREVHQQSSELSPIQPPPSKKEAFHSKSPTVVTQKPASQHGSSLMTDTPGRNTDGSGSNALPRPQTRFSAQSRGAENGPPQSNQPSHSPAQASNSADALGPRDGPKASTRAGPADASTTEAHFEKPPRGPAPDHLRPASSHLSSSGAVSSTGRFKDLPASSRLKADPSIENSHSLGQDRLKDVDASTGLSTFADIESSDFAR